MYFGAGSEFYYLGLCGLLKKFQVSKKKKKKKAADRSSIF